MASHLTDLSNELAAIVAATAPHVVSVRARRHHPSSGVRWGADLVITADHAVEREEDIGVASHGGETVSAALVGRDPGTDLAVLRVAAGAAGPELPRAAGVRAGELALVVGRSPDSGANASLGIVSAASGPWRTWRGGQLDGYVRLDAKMFPQSAGGAVVNARGELVGIATPALSRIAGLAIPASTVARVASQLVERGFVPRGYLGIGVQPVPLAEELRSKLSLANGSGLIVLAVEPGGPADRAGLLVGDVVVGFGDATVETTDDLHAFADAGVIGRAVTVKLVRAGAAGEVSLTVGERPQRQG